jgi:hypothetical protein
MFRSKRPFCITLFLLVSCTLSACENSRAASPQGPAAERWTQAHLEQVTATIQTQVEALRGEKYARPVDVEITDTRGFIEHATQRMEKLTTEAQLSAEEDVAKLLGLVPPEMDLWATTFAVLEGQVGGFYDPGNDTFYLMESFTGTLAKIILAHELTHALDDQLYDIDGTLKPLLKHRDRAAAFQAVVEGSGTAMMSQWMGAYGEPLSPAEAAQAASMGTESLSEAPPYVWKPLLASYTIGNTFLDRGYRMRKKDGLTFADVTRIAFQSPPCSTEQVLHPEKYWKESERDDPVQIELEIAPPADWKVLEESSLGELALTLMTEEPKEIDFSNPMALVFLKYTNAAARGWGGDSMVLLGSEEGRYLRVMTIWDSAKDADEFRAALEERLASWSRDVALLGEGGTVNLEPAATAAPLAVSFSAWHGVSDAQLESLAKAVSVK